MSEESIVIVSLFGCPLIIVTSDQSSSVRGVKLSTNLFAFKSSSSAEDVKSLGSFPFKSVLNKPRFVAE